MVATLGSLRGACRALDGLPGAKAFSCQVGRLCGVPVRAHATFALTLVLALLHLLWSSGFWPSAAELAFTVLLFGPLEWSMTIVHELAHVFAARRVGCTVHEIILWPLGGLASMGPAASPKDSLFVAACGPLSHIPQALLWLAIMAVCPRPAGVSLLRLLCKLVLVGGPVWHPRLPFALQLAAGTCQLNLVTMLGNLLPMVPLDGSTMLKDTLLLRGCSIERTAKWLTDISLALAAASLMLANVSPVAPQVGLWCLYETVNLLVCTVLDRERSHPMFAFSSDEREWRRPAAKFRVQHRDSAHEEAPAHRSSSGEFKAFDGASHKLGGRASVGAARRRWAAVGQGQELCGSDAMGASNY